MVLALLACKDGKRYHEAARQQIVAAKDHRIRDILEWQQQLNQEYRDPETSPLTDKDRKNFESLDFYTPDTTFTVTAIFERTPEALPFQMPTTTERTSPEKCYGVARFVRQGKEYVLEVYQNQELMLQDKYRDYLFLPFTDLTNGNATYEGGRYIDLKIPKGDELVIDFNKAYNPYCAYNKKYSCPLVPPVNHVDLAVTAGVKKFADH